MSWWCKAGLQRKLWHTALQEGGSCVWLCVLQPLTQRQCLMRGLQDHNASLGRQYDLCSWVLEHSHPLGLLLSSHQKQALSSQPKFTCQSVNGSATLPQWEIHFTLLTWSLASLDTSQGWLRREPGSYSPHQRLRSDTDKLKSFWSQLWLALSSFGWLRSVSELPNQKAHADCFALSVCHSQWKMESFYSVWGKTRPWCQGSVTLSAWRRYHPQKPMIWRLLSWNFVLGTIQTASLGTIKWHFSLWNYFK